MSNPTSNFGWQMPTPTDLVTDLPADFEVFGQAVDTAMADLLGGTSGQILAKNSNTNMDFVWITNDVGDITAVTAGTGISGGGTSGAVTITNDMATTITAAGDIVVGTGSGTYDNLPIGTTNQVLTADTTVSPYKVKWSTISTSPTFVGCSLYKSAAQTISNTTFTALTFNSESFDTDAFHSTATNTSRITIPAGKAGKYLLHGTIGYGAGSNGSTLRSAAIYKNGSAEKYVVVTLGVGNDDNGRLSFACTLDLAVADYVELYFYQASGGNLDVEGTITRTSFYATYEGA